MFWNGNVDDDDDGVVVVAAGTDNWSFCGQLTDLDRKKRKRLAVLRTPRTSQLDRRIL